VVFWSEQRFFAREAVLTSPKARLARRSLTGLRKQTGFENLPREAGIASWHVLRQPCVH